MERTKVSGVESAVTSKLSLDRARRFCAALKTDTNGRPMRWRSISSIAERARESEADQVVAIAAEQGWIEVEGDHSVCLTDKGRRL